VQAYRVFRLLFVPVVFKVMFLLTLSIWLIMVHVVVRYHLQTTLWWLHGMHALSWDYNIHNDVSRVFNNIGVD
jgi:hypothetical protein